MRSGGKTFADAGGPDGTGPCGEPNEDCSDACSDATGPGGEAGKPDGDATWEDSVADSAGDGLDVLTLRESENIAPQGTLYNINTVHMTPYNYCSYY